MSVCDHACLRTPNLDALVAELRQSKYLDLLPAYDGIGYLEGLARFSAEGLAINGAALKAGKIQKP